MTVIHKYELKSGFNCTEIKIPDNRYILHVDYQDGILCMWAVVDTNSPLRSTKVYVYGTGQPINENLQSLEYVGTVQESFCVWHVFIEYV